MKRATQLLLLAVTLTCIGCDHATKYAAVALLEPNASHAVLGSALRFELAYNPGAFMGLGGELSPAMRALLLRGVVPLAFALAFVAVLRAGIARRSTAVALGLVAGGGLGNWLDRILNGGFVTDFMSLGVGPLRTGIFNVADVAIIAGALVLVVFAHRERAAPESPAPES
jgi:signal peptidase II